jgi:2-polyprenyl-3-methyl-5-hydroxy-6-metoxy-1,4-benzoquinol methylase
MDVDAGAWDSIQAEGGLLARLLDAILQRSPLHRSFLERAVSYLRVQERERLTAILSYFEDAGRPIDYIADCYITVVEDTLAEQMYFLRHDTYRNSTYVEVADSVYHDRAYMDKYMYGLIVTAFLWPNHVEIARFFHENLPTDKAGHYLEVGPGHGYFMATAASNGAFDDLKGIDISEASIEQTRAIMGRFAPDALQRCDLEQCDFLAADTLETGRYDAIVMGEVLEHVEQPQAFLRRIHELAKDDAFIYITTCVNAPAVDHIYLWRSTDDLEAMIEASGFRITKALRLPYEGKTLEDARRMRLSINVAYLLEKIPGA